MVIQKKGCPDLIIRTAKTFLQRLKGLLFTDSLPEHTGLLLENCNSIHMFGMRYALDIVFVDKEFRICKLVPNLKPWHIAGCLKARHTVELPAGAIAEYWFRVGDLIQQPKN